MLCLIKRLSIKIHMLSRSSCKKKCRCGVVKDSRGEREISEDRDRVCETMKAQQRALESAHAERALRGTGRANLPSPTDCPKRRQHRTTADFSISCLSGWNHIGLSCRAHGTVSLPLVLMTYRTCLLIAASSMSTFHQRERETQCHKIFF